MRRIAFSMRSTSPRGTLPAASHLSWMARSAALAVSRSLTGRMAWASLSSSSLTARLPRNSSSSLAAISSLAAKKASWAALKRSHRASSSAREARPAWRQRSISRLNAPAVGPQSVLDRERLGLVDELLLGGLGLGLGGLELGEVDPAGLVEGVAGLAEPLPEGPSVSRSSRAPGALVLLPLVEQLAHPGAAALPLDLALGLAGDLLGLGHDRLALDARRRRGPALRSAASVAFGPRPAPRSRSTLASRPARSPTTLASDVLAQLGRPSATSLADRSVLARRWCSRSAEA